MPTYDFLCNSCKMRFSSFATISGKSQIECSHCGARDITQVFSAFNFVSNTGTQSHSHNKKQCSGGNCGSCSGC